MNSNRQHSDSGAKVIDMQRWESEGGHMASSQTREDILANEIVHILKDLLQSWRLPKSHRSH